MTEQPPVPTPNALDIVEMAIGFSQLPSPGGLWRAPIQALHEGLNRARQRYPDLLRGLDFSGHSIHPHSLDIQQAIASHAPTQTIRIEGPAPEWVAVDDAARQVFLTAARDEFDEETVNLMRIVARFVDSEARAIMAAENRR